MNDDYHWTGQRTLWQPMRSDANDIVDKLAAVGTLVAIHVKGSERWPERSSVVKRLGCDRGKRAFKDGMKALWSEGRRYIGSR